MGDHPEDGADVAKFFDFPEEALRARVRGNGRRKRVCVVGAGIAGLVAAYELRRAGHYVVLVEADQRVGGRIHTWNAGPTLGEFGPMRIPLDHKGTMHYVEKLGLTHEPFFQNNLDGWLRLRGKRERIVDWRKLIPLYGDPGHLFQGVKFYKRETDPVDILDQTLTTARDLLTTEEMWSVMNGALGPAAKTLSSITLWQLIEGLLDDLTGWAGPFAGTIPAAPARAQVRPPKRSFDAAGWELIGRATGTLWEEHVSALEACIEDRWVNGERRIRLVEGMEALPKGLLAEAQENGVSVRLGVVATQISSEPMDDRVRVYSTAGEIESEHGEGFHYVICAVPAAATARIGFDPPLSPQKYEALTSLAYMCAAKSLVLVDKRRWEFDDKIFCGASYTDLPIQQCWYPADNAEEDPEAMRRATRYPGIGRADDTTASKFVAIDPQRSNEPAILTAAYMTGINAERFVSQTNQERTEEVRQNLEFIHPGIGGDITDIKHCSWVERRSPGGGAWTYHGAGKLERYQDALCESHPSAASPRVFFAGEHLCVLHGWMQSAIQSSLEAVLATLDAP